MKNDINEKILRNYIVEIINLHNSSDILLIEEYDRRLDNLIAEGVLDTLKAAYGKVKGELSSTVYNALSQVNNIFINLISKGLEVAKSSAKMGLKFYRIIMNKISQFAVAHPILKKIVTIFAGTILIFSAISLFDEKSAQAELLAGEQKIDQKTYIEMRGALISHMNDIASDLDKMDTYMNMGKIITTMDSLYKSDKKYNIQDMKDAAGSYVSLSYKLVKEYTDLTKSGNSDLSKAASGILNDWIKLGKNTTINNSKP